MEQENPTDTTQKHILSESSAIGCASAFDLGALRQRIKSSIVKAKFKSLPQAERERRANEAIKTINQLIK